MQPSGAMLDSAATESSISDVSPKRDAVSQGDEFLRALRRCLENPQQPTSIGN